MTLLYRPDQPDSQNVRLRLMSAQLDLARWENYTVSQDYLTPADTVQFTIGADEDGLSEKEQEALVLGERFRVYVESLPLIEGYVDSIEISANRGGSGTLYSVQGRDRLGQALDMVADPTRQFKEGTTLAEFLKALFTPLGFISDEQYVIDNSANRAAKSGLRGTRTTKKKGKALRSFVLHQLKPYNHESVFHFASRVAQRHGLWIWVTADGEQLVVSKPDFDQEPIFALRRGRDGSGNVKSGEAKFDYTDQPSVIIADGFSGGGEFGKGRIKAAMVNPYFGTNENGTVTDEVSRLLLKYDDAVQITMTTQPFTRRPLKVPFRPMFLHDDESKTQEQLERFVRREMSLLVRKAMTAHYTVEGHGQTVEDGNFVAWTPDTVVQVDDDVADIHERLYVLGVTFTKSRGSGTSTRLDLVRLNSLEF